MRECVLPVFYVKAIGHFPPYNHPYSYRSEGRCSISIYILYINKLPINVFIKYFVLYQSSTLQININPRPSTNH